MSELAAADETLSPGGAPLRLDGRHAWRERNRNAVVDALLDLYAEGNLRPDAQEIADRSGVSRRSVFRYFDDMDDLDRAAVDRQLARVRHLFDVPDLGAGTLDERIAAITDQRVRLYETLAPMARLTRRRAAFHPVMARQLADARRSFLRQAERQFSAELDRLDAAARTETLAAADVLCSFEAYDLLVAGSGMTPAGVAAVVRRGLAALFAATA
ncbi:MAG: TetR/AcrR family transcriptional regulator [Chloroflexi bacterium]|nr:TetR/AcrR family transcriptional regulator [Chloroflexota bacterium]